MSSEKGSSKADTLVKVVLVFFISLLSFSVGTFVGKQVSDSDHRRLALEGEYKGERTVASHDEHGESAAAENKISEKEVEKLTEEFVNKEKNREPASAEHAEKDGDHHAESSEHKDESGYKTYHGKKVAGVADKKMGEDHKVEAKTKVLAKADSKTDAHGKAAHGGSDATSKAAEKVADGKAPSDGKKEARKPQSVLPSVASSAVGKYAVQVASYADESEAKNHAADMKSKGYQAFYLAASVNGKTWYRVLVGLFDSVKNADELRTQLVKEAGTKSAIVQKIVQ